MLRIDYRESDRRALLTWAESDSDFPWLDPIRRLGLDGSDDSSQESAYSLSLPWWSFASLRKQLLAIFTGYKVKMGQDYEFGSEAINLLQQSKRNTASYELARQSHAIPEDELRDFLRKIGFSRELTSQQARNVSKIAALPSAATFSVPGAGKTTEALACFFYRAAADEQLLVVAPKNAFAAWDEQITDCMPSLKAQFVRLRGGKENISLLLDDDPRFMLISYQQLARIPDLIAAHCARYKVHVYLDESHRIKSGTEKQTARAALSLAHLPVGKLIMSGTPLPQALSDLIPQFTFLYPEIPATADTVMELVKPIYVRTNKAELGLPPVTRFSVPLTMAPMQNELYKLMRSELAREAASALKTPNRQVFRRLGRSVARLLQFVSNPSLLSTELAFAHPEMLRAVLSEGDGPKLKYVLHRAGQLARNGQKVLIWSSFVRNVEYIAAQLEEYGAVYIHGGVDAGDEDDDETREGKIKLFHDNANVRIMVANPAAASEGVSLHRVCHHAIYLDRTFNAAHYLQSEDRIHRLGLPKNQETNIEIVECIGTVDETVRNRLGYKISQMAAALEDSSLCLDPIPLDPSDIENYDEYSTGLSLEDIEALVKDIPAEGR